MKKILLLTILIFFSQSSAYSLAEEKPSSEDSYDNLNNKAAWYKVYWTGVHIADLVVEVKDGSMDTVIESYGIVKKISKYASRTSSKFSFENGKYIPKSFYTQFQQRNGGKKINIVYNSSGIIEAESVTPPDKRGKRPAVKNEMKVDTVDPLTAVMVAHAKIKESLKQNIKNFSFNMYDGRRLAQLDFTIGGRMHRNINGKSYNVVMVTFVRKPIAGFTNKELSRMKEEEPVFTIYLNDDKYLMPIKADAEAPLGKAILIMEKECKSIETCGYHE